MTTRRSVPSKADYEKARKVFYDLGGVDCNKYGFVRKSTDIIAKAIADQREEDCKAICPLCRRGEPMSVEYPESHRTCKSKLGGWILERCDAATIRKGRHEA